MVDRGLGEAQRGEVGCWCLKSQSIYGRFKVSPALVGTDIISARQFLIEIAAKDDVFTGATFVFDPPDNIRQHMLKRFRICHIPTQGLPPIWGDSMPRKDY